MKRLSSRLYLSNFFQWDRPFLKWGTSLQKYHLPKQCCSLASVEIDCLLKSRIRGVILDLDNTIISEDDRYLSPGFEDWIKQARKENLQLFILSNGKRRYRVEYWSRRLGIPAISPAKKPFPGAFRKAMRHMQLQPKRVVVIGDSLHTDVLGAWVVGCPCIQVSSLPHPPRWWERILGAWVQTPYRNIQELLPFDPDDF